MKRDDTLFIDLETRSRVDLKRKGVYNYAADKSTEILIASYAILKPGQVEAPITRWEPWKGKAMPAKLQNMLADPKLTLAAHSAQFERLILGSKKLVKTTDIARWYCTATQARACALPAALEDLPRALASHMKKDHRGAQLIQQLSIPRADGTFNEDPALMEEFGEYCDQDVRAMFTASRMLPALTEEALAQYVASETINDRGLPIDAELCELALRYADAERADANARVMAVSGGALKTARGSTLTAWVYDHLPPEGREIMEVYRKGEKKTTLDTDARAQLLAMHGEFPALLDPDVVEVIEAADAAASSSVAKFQRMREMMNSDGRLRGAFVMNGASGTGRYSSKGAQLHNLPRKCAKDPEALIKLMRRKKPLPGSTLQTLKSMLRAAICAPEGRVIVRADWNAVEARGLPWLADSDGARRYLALFDDKTRDVYIEQAKVAGLGDFRQGGKVVVLALGYGGADGALSVMSKGYGVTIDDKPGTVQRWRKANRWAPDFWRALERAANRGASRREAVAGLLAYSHTGPHELPAMTVKLPSGRLLYYPMPDSDERGISYLKAAWKPKADAVQWPRARIWHGLSAENGTQAVCADLLRDVLVRSYIKLPLIGHVHDETVAEDTARNGKKLAKELAASMLALPAWAKGFPLAVETAVAQRFGK